MTKSDLFSEKDIKKKIDILKKIGKKVLAVSIIDEESLKSVEEILRKIIKEKEQIN